MLLARDPARDQVVLRGNRAQLVRPLHEPVSAPVWNDAVTKAAC
jgi:hypothetical protein